MAIDLYKHGFEKLPRKLWVSWDDYVLEEINSEYGYYLRATLHYPIKQYVDSKSLEYRMSKIILHRHLSYERFEDNLKDGESKLVYHGLIESDEDLEFLLVKLGIKKKKV